METITEGGYLYLQRSGTTTGKSTKDWGIMVTSMPTMTSMETKDPESNDWADEDGLDVYNNSSVKLKAFDAEIGLIYLGTMAGYNEKMQEMVSFLTNKRLFSIYSPHTESGKHNCYLMSMDGASVASTGDAAKPYCFTWTMKLKCTDPTSTVHCETIGTTIKLY